MFEAAVVEPADQHQIVGVGRAAVDPGDHMVCLGLTPGRRTGAGGEAAAAVAGRERAALGPVGEALGAAGAQDRAVPVEHGGEQLALIGEPQRLDRSREPDLCHT